jgi:hypothetical protein
MDITTIALAVMLAVSALGFDAVWHHGDVILDASTVGSWTSPAST